jgi:glycerate kinase
MVKDKRLLICPDSFKDCLSSEQVGKAIEEGLLDENPALQIERMIMSDGGDGVLEIFNNHPDYVRIEHESFDALGRKISTFFFWNEKRKQALISLSETIGIDRLKEEERDPMETTSYGMGVSILEALRLVPMEIVLFLGGSATNDSGIGIAEALGYRFFNKTGGPIKNLRGKNISEISAIVEPEKYPLKDVKCILAADVDNPFFGENGAVYIYGRQKGATDESLKFLENGMHSIYRLIKDAYQQDINFPGAGAAGGIAGGLSFFINGKYVSAYDWISREINFDHRIEKADVIITGEGKLDGQSKQGKLTGQIYRRAKHFNKEVYIICGSVDSSEILGFSNVFSLHETKPVVINPVLEYTLIRETAKKIARAIGNE